jgi:hypothetical protein
MALYRGIRKTGSPLVLRQDVEKQNCDEGWNSDKLTCYNSFTGLGRARQYKTNNSYINSVFR